MILRKLGIMTTAFSLLLMVMPFDVALAQSVTPQLDLKVRHVRSATNYSGWRFEVVNNDSQPINLSDLEVRFWVHGTSAIGVKTWVSGSLEDADGDSLGVVSGLTGNAEHLKLFKVYPATSKAEWLVSLKTQSLSAIPAGGRWKDVYFEYYLKNWGPIEAEQSYSQSVTYGNGNDYFENSTVGLYYQGSLVSEWKSASQADDQSGKEPLQPLSTSTPTISTNPIVSPVDGEQVCGVVQIDVNPSVTDFQLEWSADGTSWQPIVTQSFGNDWLASWDTRGLSTGNYDLRLLNEQTNSTLEQITVKVGSPQFLQSFTLPNKGIPGGLGLNGSELAVVDSQNQVVQLLSSTGSTVQTLGSYGTRLGELNQAFDLAVDSNNQLYVADTGNNRVQIMAPTTGLLGDGMLTHPIAIKAYPNEVFVLDGSAVHLFDLNGNYLYSGWLGLTGSYADVAVDETGTVYVLNSKNHSIDLYGQDFIKKTSWTGPFGSWNPSAIYYANGRLWVTDGQTNEVLKLGLNGNCLASWGGYGPSIGQFDQPGKVLADANGNVYVSDMGNNRVEKFGLGAATKTVASVTVSPTASGGLEISGFTADPSNFISTQGQVTLTYTLSEVAQVQESIQDSLGNLLVKQVYSAGSYGGQSGLNRLYWNVLSNGAPLPVGNYTITLIATANGQQSQAQVVVYVAGAGTSLPTATNTVIVLPTMTPTSTNILSNPTTVPSTIPATATETATARTTAVTPIATSTFTAVPPTKTNTPIPPTATATPRVCGTPGIFIIRPILQCVKSLGGGQYAAYFEYSNSTQDACGNNMTVTIPWGAGNQVSPSLAGTPPVEFAPGTQSAFIASFQTGQTVSWTLNGTTVSASSSSPICH